MFREIKNKAQKKVKKHLSSINKLDLLAYSEMWQYGDWKHDPFITCQFSYLGWALRCFRMFWISIYEYNWLNNVELFSEYICYMREMLSFFVSTMYNLIEPVLTIMQLLDLLRFKQYFLTDDDSLNTVNLWRLLLQIPTTCWTVFLVTRSLCPHGLP